MNKVILSCTSGWESSRRIYTRLTTEDAILDQKVSENGEPVYKRFSNLSVDSFSKRDVFHYNRNKTIAIRWGTTISVANDGELMAYNKAENIALASDKPLARKMLQKKGIAVPEIIENNNINNIYPLIARKNFHERGKDLHVISNRESYDLAVEAGYTFFSKLYPRTREFRVHCAHGKVLMVNEKPMPENPLDIKACIEYFNNEEWSDAEYWSHYDPEICKIALDAVVALGLDFGGVDVMAFPADDSFPRQVVCEVNTAPTLYGYGASRYAKYFDMLFNNQERVKHKDYSEFRNGIDFSWKNNFK